MSPPLLEQLSPVDGLRGPSTRCGVPKLTTGEQVVPLVRRHQCEDKDHERPDALTTDIPARRKSAPQLGTLPGEQRRETQRGPGGITSVSRMRPPDRNELWCFLLPCIKVCTVYTVLRARPVGLVRSVAWG